MAIFNSYVSLPEGILSSIAFHEVWLRFMQIHQNTTGIHWGPVCIKPTFPGSTPSIPRSLGASSTMSINLFEFVNIRYVSWFTMLFCCLRFMKMLSSLVVCQYFSDTAISYNVNL